LLDVIANIKQRGGLLVTTTPSFTHISIIAGMLLSKEGDKIYVSHTYIIEGLLVNKER